MKIGRNLSNALLRSEVFNRANKSFGTLLPDGEVLVANGIDQINLVALTSAELYTSDGVADSLW